MKTLLLYPSVGEEYSRYPPVLGIAYIAAVLRQHNLPVEIVDAAKYTSYAELGDELREKKPDVVGISVLSVYYDKALAAARVAKEVLPGVTVVMGGAHPTSLPEETLQNRQVDVVVFGEGEFKFLQLIETLQQRGDLAQVKGIYYRVGQEIKRTEPADYIADLDALPFPARDLIPMHQYLRRAPTLPLPYPSTTIVASRGCCGNCNYCQPTLRRLFGKKIRYRSPARVVDEMAWLKETYHVKGIFFADDEPTLDQTWVLELCREIVRRRLRVNWTCSSRVDSVDVEMLEAMKEAGCIQISFGVESGSQRILNYYRKGARVDKATQAFRMCHQVGLLARSNLMVGAPGETADDVQQTIQWIKTARPDFVVTSSTTPIAGTDLFTEAQDKGLLREGSAEAYDRFNISTLKRELSDQEVKLAIKSILRSYRAGLIKSLLNPRDISRTSRWLYYVCMHWLTMIKDVRVLVGDVAYYVNYADKEWMNAPVTDR